MTRTTLRSLLAVCSIIAVSLWVVGCGGGGSSDSSPTISNATRILPGGFVYHGDAVTIQANVVDPDGVKQVTASVTDPYGRVDPTPVAMTLTSGTLYSGTYTVPMSISPDPTTEIYTVVVMAVDMGDHTSTSPQFTIDVLGRGRPDPPGD